MQTEESRKEELVARLKAADRPTPEQEVAQEMARQQTHEKSRQLIREGLNKRGNKLRRNAKCPCLSGRKFKHCCLRRMKAELNQQPKEEIETDESED